MGCRGARAWTLAILCGVPATGQAQLADGWSISGANTARIERYDAHGDAAAGPFAHLGTTGFDEFFVTGVRRPSPWSMQRFFVSGLLNDSPYRSPHDGFVPERLHFSAESGESALAWRVEAGDFFAFTSLRTLQRSLKGASVELQPPPSPRLRQSILAFAGAAQPSWRDARWSGENAMGASWLGDTDRFGRWTATYVRSERGPDALAADRRTQSVASLAGESLFDLGGWKLRAEGEVARFDGDHDGGADGPARDASDTGAFAQLSAFDALFHGRLRAERYGRDFRPFGAITPADRRAFEAHAGVNLPQGLSLRARYQDSRDQWEGANPLDTEVAGVNVSGSYAPLALTGTFDAFVQDSTRNDGSLDARFRQASINLSRPLGRWVALFNASRLENDDRLDDGRSFTTTQAQVGTLIPVRWGGLDGTLSPGVLHRRTTGSGATRDWQPTLALSLFGGAHRFNATYNRLDQDPRGTVGMPEVLTVNASLDYRYRWRDHEFGVDILWFDRDPDPGDATEAWRLGASWTWHFDGAAVARATSASAPAPAPPVEATLPRSVVLLARLVPGQELAPARRALQASGFGAGIDEPRSVAYEARLLEDIEQRQRLVLAHAGGLVERVALVVSLEGAADPARTYERVRRALLDAFGAPGATYDEGAWSASYAREVAAGRFIRVTEWATPHGVIRLGIPRRLDGPPRIEIQHARRFPSPRDPSWALE